MRQPGAPRRSQKPLDRQPRTHQPQDWRKPTRDDAGQLKPASPFGQQLNEKLSQFQEDHKPPLSEHPSEP